MLSDLPFFVALSRFRVSFRNEFVYFLPDFYQRKVARGFQQFLEVLLEIRGRFGFLHQLCPATSGFTCK
ncbi:hypothetical protein PMAYCL1PPCAC_04686 [Pristionchus mayeri]|uniref:Uncharacterized protein n=1 Tax=Pristionchus mayeri TaxID=1317129 RepID=A0AAN5CAZ6_9BILA|nr:hypothetical protein PMAYCL1PPCAC_04686 [Pristionchus mayeri]